VSDLFAPKKNTVTEVTRRSIIDPLIVGDIQYAGRLDQIDFLKRVWDLKSMPSTDRRFKDLEGDLWQHTVNNPDYDDSEVLYGHLKILESSDETFGTFLATCLHPILRRTDAEYATLLNQFNTELGKDGFALISDSSISGRPIYRMISHSGGPGSRYEVVLSFAGEQQRYYVEAVAAVLKARGVSVFYDKYEEATLWGKDLVEHLDAVYGGGARYCMIFSSAEYAEKVWSTHERRSALERAVNARIEYILPVRFDDTELPGIRSTVGYVRAQAKTPEALADPILQKLGR